ncbi:hypothetical protein EYZ11_002846 [Aspergillus tanneri]|nr:hypothetical protein EYZ11_002846 [Aspergillus tanneri]
MYKGVEEAIAKRKGKPFKEKFVQGPRMGLAL